MSDGEAGGRAGSRGSGAMGGREGGSPALSNDTASMCLYLQLRPPLS
jgi:hypothetical protein